jgi:predicted nucleotidyltransferase component of viral defense system
MVPNQFSSAKAFRTSLEERLKTHARKQGLDLQRLRRQVAFDRLLARLFLEPEGSWILKGGYAMELEFESVRSTVDLDLTVRRSVQRYRDGHSSASLAGGSRTFDWGFL